MFMNNNWWIRFDNQKGSRIVWNSLCNLLVECVRRWKGMKFNRVMILLLLLSLLLGGAVRGKIVPKAFGLSEREVVFCESYFIFVSVIKINWVPSFDSIRPGSKYWRIVKAQCGGASSCWKNKFYLRDHFHHLPLYQ